MTGRGDHQGDIPFKTNLNLVVTEHMELWLREIFASGAISFGPSGMVSLNPEVRQVISALHSVLAGGKIELNIVQRGGERGEQLEKFFDLAWEETNMVLKSQSQDGNTPKFDPVSP